jgi:hypothetical protein
MIMTCPTGCEKGKNVITHESSSHRPAEDAEAKVLVIGVVGRLEGLGAAGEEVHAESWRRAR